MRCKRCKACKTEGVEYPEEYCCIGVSDDEINEDRNGDLGCIFIGKQLIISFAKKAKFFKNHGVCQTGMDCKRESEKALFLYPIYFVYKHAQKTFSVKLIIGGFSHEYCS